MRWAMIIIGVLLALTGGVWLLQGVGLLLGSFMTGQSFWAAIGLLALIAGFVLIYIGALRSRRSQP
jgi:hypothetical protein